MSAPAVEPGSSPALSGLTLPGSTGSVVDDYPLPDARWDEMLAPNRSVRPPWREVGALLDVLGPVGLRERSDTVRRLLEDDGVTYRAHGAPIDQAWSLDPVPMVVDEAQWAALEPGLVQRAELLDVVLSDLYGARQLISRGLVPPELVLGHSGFLREVDQIRLRGTHQLFLAATDLARDADGTWRVLADRTQAPSGAGYAMENRRAISRAMTGLHRASNIHRIGPFFQAMRQSLQRLSPTQHEAPRVVLLTPGAGSETGFDQAYLSSLLGFPLVEGSDLVFRDGRVWQRSVTGRSEPIDVILRRVDSWFCDPLELRPDSQLGVPGLVEASRLGAVSVANPLGAGVLENPGLYSFLPAICEALLGEPLRLQSARTWWCGDPVARAHALSQMESLVFKPIARLVGRSSKLGWLLSADQRAELAARIESEPHSWVAQEALSLSSAPTVTRAGLEPRPVLLRTFAVSDGPTFRVMPGGLVRVANSADADIVSNLDGATSKDLWVLSPGAQLADLAVVPDPLTPDAVSNAVSPRVAADLFWLGRYAERAEEVARLLRVTDDRWRDVHAAADPALTRCLRVLLESVTSVTATYPGFIGDGAAARLTKPRDELLSLLGDELRPGTIAHDVRRLRELANAVRDQLSSDTWLVLGGLDRTLAPFQAATRGWAAANDITPALASVLSSLLAFSGVVAENMVRDDGWAYLDLGRRLERAIGISELLSANLSQAHDVEAEALIMESTLIAADSLITHRRRFTAGAGAETVLSLLLIDRENPRSVAYQLDHISNDISRLGPSGESLKRQVLDIAARLHESDPAALAVASHGRREALAGVLDPLRQALGELNTTIASSHFVPPAALVPLNPFVMLGSA
ncbi:uncharacterized circularly permuted ATP-grasp superfamily protein [Jatrophihabitans sp. GAS493]|uniref:circularly permuted type 2 ATP-grasp protein n=1 Tax=Jatrophihabitans sp. GAS493 TaxID=1907575 RepID=UPI000BC0A054|nr:circularly permuted type 2 ATP-grasp protein [Jatrophihabitans sp. GAS493]SOD73411.1 uncharacterized circularly permuted ATP-grasp superfamily protein [Jatrophihabitans sp. GAS493]